MAWPPSRSRVPDLSAMPQDQHFWIIPPQDGAVATIHRLYFRSSPSRHLMSTFCMQVHGPVALASTYNKAGPWLQGGSHVMGQPDANSVNNRVKAGEGPTTDKNGWYQEVCL